MKKIIVLVAGGKGEGSADWVMVKTFDTNDEAQSYIKETNELESKYWTRAEIVEEGKAIEPCKEEFY